MFSVIFSSGTLYHVVDKTLSLKVNCFVLQYYEHSELEDGSLGVFILQALRA